VQANKMGLMVVLNRNTGEAGLSDRGESLSGLRCAG